MADEKTIEVTFTVQELKQIQALEAAYGLDEPTWDMTIKAILKETYRRSKKAQTAARKISTRKISQQLERQRISCMQMERHMR